MTDRDETKAEEIFKSWYRDVQYPSTFVMDKDKKSLLKILAITLKDCLDKAVESEREVCINVVKNLPVHFLNESNQAWTLDAGEIKNRIISKIRNRGEKP